MLLSTSMVVMLKLQTFKSMKRLTDRVIDPSYTTSFYVL